MEDLSYRTKRKSYHLECSEIGMAKKGDSRAKDKARSTSVLIVPMGMLRNRLYLV